MPGLDAGDDRVRLVATDLDGTLLRSDGTVSPRSRRALEQAESAGLLIVFVTGRPLRWIDEVVDQTGHLGVAVGANGAIVYDIAAEQVIAAHVLPVPTTRLLAAELRAAFPEVAFAVEWVEGFAAEQRYVHDWTINPRVDRRGDPVPEPATGTLDEITARPALKLLAKDRGVSADEFLDSAETILAGRATVTHSSSFGLLEIAAPGVTKATGLAQVAARHGIARDCIAAIGDMPNDIAMLKWAGRSYAVANAHPATKAAADHVVASNDDDAVAVLIESVLAADAGHG